MNSQDWTVVGVVGDVYQSSLETEPRTEAYTPIGQSTVIFGELVVRTTGNPYDVLPAIKGAVLGVLPDVPLRSVRTMDEVIDRRVAQRKLNMLLLGLFGLLGLVISAVGIYGVMAYVVAQRTREIGVRMALGATRRSVVGMVLTRAALMVAIGLALGTAGAWLLRESASAFLFRMQTDDPRAFAAALGALVVAALVASALPARRAASVDPIVALRAD
jgi:predicted lysophospholipase L1 biosynthesis ABC-type transport system permease subunit